MEYKILEAQNVDALIQIVNEHIELGWKPQGGISVIKNNVRDRSYDCYQAMVKN